MKQYKKPRQKMGPTMQKVLVLLSGGLALGFARRPDKYFKILKSMSRAWRAINRRALYRAIKSLYYSKLIDYKEALDGTVSLILTDDGKRKILRYNLDKMTIKKPSQWDGWWRLVIFDIPEKKNQGRKALSSKLKELGFYPMQKSVFIYPYECKDEIDFISEIFDIKPYVRFLVVKETDIDLHLKTNFGL